MAEKKKNTSITEIKAHKEPPGLVALGSPSHILVFTNESGVSTATPAKRPPKVPPERPRQEQVIPLTEEDVAVAAASPPLSPAAAMAFVTACFIVGVRGRFARPLRVSMAGRVAVHG